MAKAGVIETQGVILKEEGNGFFAVELTNPEGHRCHCRASGRLVTRKIHLLAGDHVNVELSVYDLSKGRIVYRNTSKPSNGPK
jgi:translation initiation factor IF-1